VWNTAVPLDRPSTCSQRAHGTLPPDTKSNHYVPCGPTVDGGASPGTPRNPHGIQNGPAGVSSRARLWRTTENPRRATDPDNRPSGTSAPHHTTSPAHGPPETSSGSVPRLPSTICAQGPQIARTSFPARTQFTGLWSPHTAAPSKSSRRQKTMQLLVRGKPVTVSADRVKPAYILNEATCRNTTSNRNPATVPPTAPPPRRRRFPHMPQQLVKESPRGGGLMWEPPTKLQESGGGLVTWLLSRVAQQWRNCPEGVSISSALR
jgi:hypothetical protein